MKAWEYYLEEIPSSVVKVLFHTVRERGGQNIVRLHNEEQARLIAAAPELLEACEILIEQYESSGDFKMGGNLTNKPFLLAKAAIAKAKGQSK